jgi:hypothetical protein
MLSVPGITRFHTPKLEERGISNTYKLFGVFMLLRRPKRSCKDLCNDMWELLTDCGIKTNRSIIVTALGEKLDTMMPGFCDMAQLSMDGADNEEYNYRWGWRSISEEKISEFLLAPAVQDILSVPGMNHFNAHKLEEKGILNTYQLLGVFCSLRSSIRYQSCEDLCNDMWKWLTDCGIKTNRSSIVTSLVDKLDTMMPGFCDTDTLR